MQNIGPHRLSPTGPVSPPTTEPAELNAKFHQNVGPNDGGRTCYGSREDDYLNTFGFANLSRKNAHDKSRPNMSLRHTTPPCRRANVAE